MDILDPNQQEILQRVLAGYYLGDLPAAQLQRDVTLLLELRLIEPTGVCPYRLTMIGESVLAAAARQSSS